MVGWIEAMSAARSKKTYLGVKYRRIAARRGPMKAIVAVEHAMLVEIWNMTATGAPYEDPDRTSTLAATQTEPNAAPSNSFGAWARPSHSDRPGNQEAPARRESSSQSRSDLRS